MTAGDRTSDYDFDLPADLIAQRPLARRDASRLMVIDRATGEIQHRTFVDIVATRRAKRRPGREPYARHSRAAARLARVRRPRGDSASQTARRRTLRGDGFAGREAQAGSPRDDRAGIRRRDSRGDRPAHAHRAARERPAARRGHRTAWPRPPSTVHRTAGCVRGRRAIPDGLRAREGIGRRADGGAALHAGVVVVARTRAASRPRRSCCTSARERSSRSRSTTRRRM